MKKRFGGGSATVPDPRAERIKQAAQRRMGSAAPTARGPKFAGKVSGGGLGSATSAGPSTSPLAAKRQAALVAQTGGPGRPLAPGLAKKPEDNAKGKPFGK